MTEKGDEEVDIKVNVKMSDFDLHLKKMIEKVLKPAGLIFRYTLLIQGDTSGCDAPPVDFKKKSSVLAWPGQDMPGQNGTFVLNSTRGSAQPDVSPCKTLQKKMEKKNFFKMDLYARVSPVGDDNVVLRVDGDAGGRVELAVALAVRTEAELEISVRVEYL